MLSFHCSNSSLFNYQQQAANLKLFVTQYDVDRGPKVNQAIKVKNKLFLRLKLNLFSFLIYIYLFLHPYKHWQWPYFTFR